MTRTLYEAAALIYGLVTLVTLMIVAMWLGERTAVLLMVGAQVSAYGCQVLAAMGHIFATDEPEPSREVKWLVGVSWCLWAVSAVFAGAAIAIMVL